MKKFTPPSTRSDPDSHKSPPPDRNTDAGCNTAPFPCHGAAPAAGSPGAGPAGCTPAAHCPRGPASRPRPPGRSGPSGPLACPVGRSGSGMAMRCCRSCSCSFACMPLSRRVAPSACSPRIAWALGCRLCAWRSA